MNTESVEIVEVAPRDGFQSIAEPLPTAEKIDIIEALFDAGCRRVEIGSFVSPKAVPQMADMAEIAQAVMPRIRDRADLRACVLIPNARGAEIALEHGIRDLGYVFSASERHNRENVNRSVDESIEALADLVGDFYGEPVQLRVNIATAFDCPFDGSVPLERVMACVDRAHAIAPTAEIALCDTTGRASPIEVSQRFERARDRTDASVTWAFHGHDTFGMGVANALAAWRAGVTVFDGSCSGLGGCPFAPGASGNTATEDLVYAFARGGVDTGIDLPALTAVARRIAALPGGMTGGHLRDVPAERVQV